MRCPVLPTRSIRVHMVHAILDDFDAKGSCTHATGILDCLRGSPDRRPLEPGSMEWLIKRSLAKPCRV